MVAKMIYKSELKIQKKIGSSWICEKSPALLIKVYSVDLGKSQFYLASTFEEDNIASSLNQSFTVNPNNHLLSYPKILNIASDNPEDHLFN